MTNAEGGIQADRELKLCLQGYILHFSRARAAN